MFDGLDLYAQVFLNGVFLGQAQNAFVPHAFDVRQARTFFTAFARHVHCQAAFKRERNGCGRAIGQRIGHALSQKRAVGKDRQRSAL